MRYQHATIVVTTAVAVNMRKLSQMLDRGECDGMLVSALSPTGAMPATHFISSGFVPKIYIKALGTPAKLKQAADAAYLAEGIPQPFSLAQITNALGKCTISDVELHVFIHQSADEGIMGMLAKILHLEKSIMTKITDFAVAQKAHNDAISTSLDGLAGDIGTLNAKITELQNSPGQITAEDQALLDELQAQGQALETRIAEADALTPPPVPPGV